MKTQVTSVKGKLLSYKSTDSDISTEKGTHNVSDWIFCLGVAVWSLNEFIKFSEISEHVPSSLPMIFRFSGIAFIFISFFLRDFLRIDALRFILLGTFLSFIVINNGLLARDSNWIDIALLSIGSIGVHYDKIFEFLAGYRFIINIFLIGLVFVSILPNKVDITQDRLRYYWGYNWTSFVAHTILFITLLLLWSRKEKIGIFLFSSLFCINLWAYLQTQTKAPFIITAICLIVWFVAAKFKVHFINSHILKLGTIFALPILMLIILYLSYNAYSFPQINDLLTNRLVLGRTYLDQYGLTIFGHPIYEATEIDWFGLTFQTLDSSLMRYLVKYGLLSSVLFIAVWMYISQRITKLNDFYLDLVLICLALEAFGDPWFLFASYNIFIILLGSVALTDDQFLETINN